MHPIRFAAPPPKPADTTFTLVSEKTDEFGQSDLVYRLTWTEPEGYASGFHVYGITACYTSTEGRPCIALGMHTRVEDRKLLGTPSGTKRALRIRMKGSFEGHLSYNSVLVAAFNDYGESKAAIAWTCIAWESCNPNQNPFERGD